MPAEDVGYTCVPSLMQIYGKCTVSGFEHTGACFRSCIKAGPVGVLGLSIGRSHHLKRHLGPLSVSEAVMFGRESPLHGPVSILSSVPQKEAGEVPGTFFALKVGMTSKQKSWSPNVGLTVLCKCMSAAAAAAAGAAQ